MCRVSADLRRYMAYEPSEAHLIEFERRVNEYIGSTVLTDPTGLQAFGFVDSEAKRIVATYESLPTDDNYMRPRLLDEKYHEDWDYIEGIVERVRDYAERRVTE